MYYNIICLELRTWEVEFRSQTLDLAISNFLGLLILGFRIQNLELRIWSWSPRSQALDFRIWSPLLTNSL